MQITEKEHRLTHILLGRSSINTTRSYTIESGYVHRKQLEKMKLLDIKKPPTGADGF